MLVKKMMENISKECKKCGEMKDISLFDKINKNKYGYNNLCKDCDVPIFKNNKLHRKCSKCKEIKSIDDFYKNYYSCKTCHGYYVDNYKHRNKHKYNCIICNKQSKYNVCKDCKKCINYIHENNILEKIIEYKKM
jgi:hypothetical protein